MSLNSQQHSVILQQLYNTIITVSDMCHKTLLIQYVNVGIFMLAHEYSNVSILCYVSKRSNYTSIWWDFWIVWAISK